MKPDTLHQARSLIQWVVIPLCGVAAFFVQLFLPGERLSLLAGSVAMMGLPAVVYGASRLDRAQNEKDDKP